MKTTVNMKFDKLLQFFQRRFFRAANLRKRLDIPARLHKKSEFFSFTGSHKE